jgi:hypothetical protein
MSNLLSLKLFKSFLRKYEMANASESLTTSDQPPPIEHIGGNADRPRQLSYLATTSLTPNPENPRKHSRAQVRAIAKSLDAFGFNAPILIDKNRKIVAGHGRYEAAKLLGLPQIPVLFLDHLNEIQAKAYMLADNKLTDRSTWDDAKVARPVEGIVRFSPGF